MDKIYVDYKKKYKETPEEFFNRLYEGDYGFPRTYFDKNCTNKHCDKGKARSFSDLYKVMKTYYPRITQKLLIKIIINKCTDDNHYNLIYCDNVEKIVLYKGTWELTYEQIPHRTLFNQTYFDYSHFLSDDKIKEIDKFTIYYLYNKLGYTTEEIKTELKKLK